MRSFMQPLYHKPHKGGHSIPPPIPILLPTRYNRKTAPATFDKPRLTPVNARALLVCPFARSHALRGNAGEPLRGWSVFTRQVRRGAERPVCITPQSGVTSLVELEELT